MELLYLSDILKGSELDLSEVLLIRYGLSNKLFKKYYITKRLKEYTQIQRKNNFPKGDYKYLITFIGDGGNLALLAKCYSVTKSEQNVVDLKLNKTLKKLIRKKCSKSKPIYFDIEEINLFNNFEYKLIIDWGKNPSIWTQDANNKNKIITTQPKQKKRFESYENLILTYEELREIVKDKLTYSDWHIALSSIYAIYLIVDKESGKQYVGSAYGEGGLFERWSKYVKTKHSKNSKMVNLLEDNPEGYREFQFSILRICSKNMKNEDIISLENLYKEKLLTREFGLNGN